MLQCCNVSLRITIPRDCYPQANIATLQHCNIATLLTIQQLGDCYPQANIATLQHCQIANNPIILTIQQCNKVGGTGGLPKNASESHSVDGVLRDNGPKEYHCHALRSYGCEPLVNHFKAHGFQQGTLRLFIIIYLLLLILM